MKKFIVCCLCLFGVGALKMAAQDQPVILTGKTTLEELRKQGENQKLAQSNAIWQK